MYVYIKMGKTMYNACINMLRLCTKKTITLEELKMGITIHIGGGFGTQRQNLAIMLSTGLIKDVGNSRFELNSKLINEN